MKITDAGAFKDWGDGFFMGWDLPFGPDVENPFVTKSERIFKNNYNIKVNNSTDKNELGLVQFLLKQNLGAELYSADNNFNWSKLTLSNNVVQSTPCN